MFELKVSNDNSLSKNNSSDFDNEEQQELAKHISFYGYDFENYYYFGSNDSYMLSRLKSYELTEKKLLSNFIKSRFMV